MSNNKPQSWSELAIGLYEKLTERNAEISYEAENLQVMVPAAATADAPQAPWNVNGTVRVRTRDLASN